MINEENLTKLYEDILKNVELTTKELNSFGFNSNDLNKLIEQGDIIRVKRGIYSLKSVDKLFYYGKKLIAQKEYNKANQCFLKCFEIDPTHNGVCFQLFLRCIKNKDYKKAFEYFDIFYNNENKFYLADCNFYLYMLSMITEVPENHREHAKLLKFLDISVDFEDKRYENVQLQNQIRLFALNQSFISASKKFKESIQEKESLTVQDIIIKTLLNQAIETQTQNRKNVINLIKQKKYEEIIELYKKMLSFHNLSKSDNYTFILTNDLLNIIQTKTIPKKQVYNTKYIFEAIDGKNFELALSLASLNQKYSANKDDNAIILLLDEIVYRCNELNNNVSQNQKIVSNNLEKAVKPFDNNVETEQNAIANIAMSADIIKFLMKGDFDTTFRLLRSYLEKINKIDYEFLIVDLIKISILKKDITFATPMTVLTLISRENYSFDFPTYIQDFYINLSQSKFEEARIYLDIISKGNKLGQDCAIIDNLYKVLETSEKILDYKRNDTTLKVIDEALEKSKKIQVKPKIVQREKIIQQKRDPEKEFIDKKYEKLLNKKGIILLRPMDNDRIDKIINMIKNYPDMVAFVIGEENEQQIVLRYKPTTNKEVPYKKIIKLGNQAYKEGNYDVCIEAYLQLLQSFDKPRSIVYSKLGLTYLKKGKKNIAIDYLTVATDLAKKEKVDFDFSDLITNLKNGKSEDRKPYFIMTQNDFNYDDVNDYYGIDNFTEINSFIIESGLDVETACKQLGLSLEEIDIIKLIYARKYYSQGNYDTGDIFLKSVEISKNKTENTKKILEEIRKNKKFYKNRKSNTDIAQVLSLLPKLPKKK